MMNAIEQRFNQPSFATHAKMKSILIKTLNQQDKSEELKFMDKLYNDDVDVSMLTAQMKILQVLLKDGDYSCFGNIIVKKIGPQCVLVWDFSELNVDAQLYCKSNNFFFYYSDKC